MNHWRLADAVSRMPRFQFAERFAENRNWFDLGKRWRSLLEIIGPLPHRSSIRQHPLQFTDLRAQGPQLSMQVRLDVVLSLLQRLHRLLMLGLAVFLHGVDDDSDE